MGTLLTGVNDPIATTPPRPASSIRRTSHVDIDDAAGGGLVLRGAARDLRTRADGTATVVGAAEVVATLDGAHRLVDLGTSAPAALTAPLLGLPVGRGFRAAVDELLPEERHTSTPLYVLLDELPVAALISGYALLYSGKLGDRQRDAPVKEDICAGWRSDGTMMVSLRGTGAIPVPLGPEATDLVPDDDALAWHEIAPLPIGAMRRQRLVEVADGDPMAVYAMFRDTHADDDGATTILHEYSLRAAIDPDTMVLTSCEARPQVLPWTECPAAAASAGALAGHDVGQVRQLVRERFRGTSTCTHLNDLLRSLGDLAALAPMAGARS